MKQKTRMMCQETDGISIHLDTLPTWTDGPNSQLHASIHPSTHPLYLLAKCQHDANNNAIDNAKWSTEQKRETLC